MNYIYQILIEYDGTNFNGWQKQKKGRSVQGIIEKILKKILKQKIVIYGSGRTDSGVHALEQSAHFFLKKKIKKPNKILKSLNFFLNKYYISILNLREKKNFFHARFSAKKRVYRYIILNRIGNPSLMNNKVWFVQKKIDIKKMKSAIKMFIGTKDFSAFRSSSCGAKSPIKTIDNASVKKSGDLIIINFRSKSFLKQQVRSMVGCLKKIGDGSWSKKYLKKVINSKNRSYCAQVAPPEGLYLEKVYY